MLLHDTSKKFGVISIVLHWVTAGFVLLLLITGLFIVFVNWAASGLAPGDHHTVRVDPIVVGQTADTLRALRVDAVYLHILLALISIPFIVWRVYHRIRSGHPREPHQGRALSWLTSVNWPVLLIMIVVMYVSGPFLPLLHGMSINAYGVTLFPAIFPMGVRQLDDVHAALILPVHVWVAIGMALLLGLHIAGALKHWLVDKDGVLERMLRPGELRERNDAAAASAAGGVARASAVIAWSSGIIVAATAVMTAFFYINLATGRWMSDPSLIRGPGSRQQQSQPAPQSGDPHGSAPPR